MSSNKKYWKSVEELNDNSSIVEALKNNEFVEEIPVDEFLGDKETLESSSTSRRDFLKYVGFSTAAASLAACEGPVVKSIPYVVKPQEIIPGVPNYYATTIANGYDFASVLVKTREGRPIKIENNKEALTNGSANARVNASVLDLYDSLRVSAPQKKGEPISWEVFELETLNKLNELKAANKQIVLLTQTFSSPSTTKLVKEFDAKFGNVKHVTYDAISESAALDAFEKKYGVRGLADYDFKEAMTIVSVDADFLGDWQGGGFDSGYAKNRIPRHRRMSRHVQFESNMTLSGANADKRVPLKPSQLKLVLAKLYSYIMGTSISGELPKNIDIAVRNAASQLKRAGRNGVLVTGIQDVDAQLIALEINEKLSSKAFNSKTPIKTRQGNTKAVNTLIANMKSGQVGAIIMCGVNPVYTLPNSKEFLEGLKKTALSIDFTMKNDETAAHCQYIAATPHYLESWGDVEIKKNHFSLIQPTIRPLFDTRQFQDVLLKWNGSSVAYLDYIKATWKKDILNGKSFSKALHDGVFKKTELAVVPKPVVVKKTKKRRGKKGKRVKAPVVPLVVKETAPLAVIVPGEAARSLASKATSKGMELVLYPKTGMGDGQYANNAWLQEFPDPISRVSWDNYVTMSKADAEALNVKNWNVADGALNGNRVKVTVNGTSVIAPVIIQPGQAKGSIGLSFGYGRKCKGLKQEMQTGVNAYALYKGFDNIQNAKVELVDGTHEFACVQLHNTLMGRGDIIRETDLDTYNNKPKEDWNPVPEVSLDHNPVAVNSPEVDLWESFDRSIGHHFKLSIDLNACTGCGACVIACHAENNVPVVGKEEVRRSRDMHWLRIDRYYSSQDSFENDNEKKDNISGLGSSLSEFGEMENPSENPQVAFQPVMCQHCNHAPCETVCPVAATSHGRQGQNNMAYNRCVGTRYCANNCPYKVRRFNWFLYNKNPEFDYFMNDDLGRMVINPDVVVRSRGVMEKCSFCIQSTQAVILKAKREGRRVKEGEFNDACACSAACSSGAMIFGDRNEKNSEVAVLENSNRKYYLLEHIGTEPNVFYQTKVRNTTEEV